MLGHLLRGSQTQPRGGARREVLNEDVRGGDQLVEHAATGGHREVQGDGLLVAVDPDEVTAHAPDLRVVGPSEVTVSDALDLDDAGTHVGQVP